MCGSELEELEPLRVGLRIMALQALQDSEAAEEAAQETLVRAIEALQKGRLNDRTKLAAFVHGIARNVISEMWRERRRVVLPLDVVDGARHAGSSPDPLGLVISNEERERVRLALTQLSESDREVLRLSFTERLAPRQIAQRLDESSDTIRQRKSRALDRLRRALQKPDPNCHKPPRSDT